MRGWKKWVAGLALAFGTSVLVAQDLAPPQLDRTKAADAQQPGATPPVDPVGTPQLTKTDVDGWLSGFMSYAIESGDIAGAVVVVVKDGQILTQRGFGYADVKKRTPVSPETTLFRIGSVSKLATWTAVMQLVEQGKLDLDADVNTYLDFKIPAYDGKPITLRQVMTHTAGFQETVRRLISDQQSDMVPLATYVKLPPARIFAPGTTPAYSNYATALAGYIVARQSGMDFDTYVEQRIFAPLDMKYATFRQPVPKALAPHLAQGYPAASAAAKPFEYVIPAPAGSQSASGTAMAKFMIAHLQGGAGLMKPETAKQMHDFRLDILPPLDRMALGFYEDDVNGHRVIAHGGDTVYMHSNLSLFIDDGVGLFVSVNSAGKGGAVRVLREELLKDFADRYFPAPPEGKAIDADTARDHARMMVGRYESSRGFRTNFLSALGLFGQEAIGLDAEGGLIVPSATNAAGQPRKWIEIAPFVWRDRDSDLKLAAKVENGVVTRWSFDTISPFMTSLRVPWYRNAAWLNPAIYLALVVLLLSALAWPVGAIARRRYRAAARHEGRRLRDHRILHLWYWLVLALLVGWMIWFTTAFASLHLLGGPLDPLLIPLQVLTPVLLGGLVVLTGWNLRQAWVEKRGWFSLIWSTLLLLSAAILLWFAFAGHLIGFGTNY